jgi:S-adenosylmethionine:tRNA ribosyltransferase-isomerase
VQLSLGSVITIADGLTVEVIAVSPKSPRLVTVRFNRKGADLWMAIYAFGKPIQYSYQTGNLELWSTQTIYASRPWAVEMPSAGQSLSWKTIRALRQYGVQVACVTHAAGLSSTGDEDLDDILPLAERFDIPDSTVELIESTRQFGGRVIAVGTTVVRALEGCARQHDGRLRSGTGVTDLIVNSRFRPRIVQGIMTGVHETSESHFRLLKAFTDETTLRRAWRHASEAGYLSHEFGDACLIARGSLALRASSLSLVKRASFETCEGAPCDGSDDVDAEDVAGAVREA